MARKPFVIANRQREARERFYRAAPAIGSYRGVEEVVIELTFNDAEGKLHPSQQRRVFAADMQAFFDFQCPLRDCEGGSFDATADVQAGLSGQRAERGGKLVCQGVRPRNGVKDHRCNLELTYRVLVRETGAVAA